MKTDRLIFKRPRHRHEVMSKHKKFAFERKHVTDMERVFLHVSVTGPSRPVSVSYQEFPWETGHHFPATGNRISYGSSIVCSVSFSQHRSLLGASK